MSLRSFLAALVAGFALLSLTAAGAALRVTSLLHTTVSESHEVFLSTRAAERARAELLALDETLARVDLGQARDQALRRHEDAIRAALTDAELRATRAPEQALLDEARARLREYLDLERATQGTTPSQRAGASRAAFGRAHEAVEGFARAQDRRAAALQSEARQLDREGDAWGYAAAALALIGSVALAGLSWRWLALPLLELRDATARFVRGERSRPVWARGPRELAEAIRTFNAMTSTLERQRAGQLTFLAGVVHDLRNPLTALRAGLATLPPDRPLPEEPRVRRLLALVGRQVDRLDRMTGDLLDSARANAGQLALHVETRDLRDVVQEVVGLFADAAVHHPIALALPPDAAWVACDPTRMEQVLGNLLSNAIKYSPQGSAVDVSVSTQGAQVVLEVTDRGMGIGAEELPRIFDPFQRVGRPDEAPGSGLGLSVVKRIVEGHGGSIEVDSAPGRGSTFRVLLPSVSGPRAEPPQLHDA